VRSNGLAAAIGRAGNASIRRLPNEPHPSRPRRLTRSYLVRLLHSLPSPGLTPTHPDTFYALRKTT
jgi:hypothetical protein